MTDYERLANEKVTKARDWTERWGQLRPVLDVTGSRREEIDQFCSRKRFTTNALAKFKTRFTVDREVPCLAYGGGNGKGQIVAIKYRPLTGTSKDSWAETPSVWVQPIIYNEHDSRNWLVAEGETDAARLYELTGGTCAILVMPSGALTFKPLWAQLISRGASVGLCLDADDAGDKGAEKAAAIIGGNTFRVRPPIEGGDWCDWDGDSDAFFSLAAQARPPRSQFASYQEFATQDFVTAETLLGEPGEPLLAVGSLLMVYGADGSGKSTWTIDGLIHLAAGTDWLGITVPRPARVLIIENEGPPSLFQRKLREKVATWDGPDPTPNLFVYTSPWGEFTFANADARETLREYCDEHQIEVVAANPTLGLGVGTSGKPDETQQFVDWLTECGLKSTRTFWLLHHENKSGQISGDWGRHPDTKVSLQRDGDKPRTRLDWAKTRWANPEQKIVMLEWITETQSYSVTEMSDVVTDTEMDERIREFLDIYPRSSTTAVTEGVTGKAAHIRKRLNEGLFDAIKGAKNANLWFNRDSTPSQSWDGVGRGTGQDPNDQ